MATTNKVQISNQKSQYTRFTRMMAAFTASLFLVAPNAALACRNEGLAEQRAVRAARMETNRQLRQERRANMVQVRANQQQNVVNNPVINQAAVQVLQGNERKGNALQQQRHAEKMARFVTQTHGTNSAVKLENGAKLDLTSTGRDITLGTKLMKNGVVTIDVGGEKKSLYGGSQVTAAEYIAVKQVLSGGQKLTLDQDGRATGGQFDLNAIAANKNTVRADSLVVAGGVTAVGDLAKNSTFRVSSDLNNYGSLYTISSKGGRHGGSISADNITNQEGAVISSEAPANLGNRASQIDLSLNANKNFTNLGTVETSGDLSVSAGETITNGANSQITANNVKLDSPQINNQGTVTARAGDVTLTSAGALNVNNAGGTINAAQAINVREAGYNGSEASNVVGGDLLSNQLNVHAGQALANVDVNQLTGKVVSDGLAAHVSANTENLVIGKTCLTGDPIYKNSTGDITIDGDIVVGEALAILARGDVIGTNNLTLIQANDGTDGKDITIAAGFVITGGGGAATDSSTIPPEVEATTSNVSLFNGTGANGGSINFSASDVVIDASGVTGRGGNVILAAKADGGNTVGDVLLSLDSTIDTSAVSGINGDITVLAGRNSASSTIRLGNLLADGGLGTTGGNILVRTSQPSVGGGVQFDLDGNIVSGNFVGGTLSSGASINIGNGFSPAKNILAGGNITINSGAGGLQLDLGNGSIATRTGDINITALGTGDSDIFIGATNGIQSNGGDIFIAANGSVGIFNPAGIDSTSLAGGAGGDITLRADMNGNQAGSVNASGVNLTAFGQATFNGGDVAVDVNGSIGSTQSVTVGNIDTSTVGATAGNVDVHSGGGALTVGSITAFGNPGGIVDIDTNSNNANITLNGDIQASSVDISANGAGTITAGNTNLNIATDSYTVSSPLIATGGIVNIRPLTNGTTIGVAGGAGSLSISAAELSSITADQVVIGSNQTGAISVGNNLNLAGSSFDLEFQGDKFSTGLNDISMGGNSILIDTFNGASTDQISTTSGGISVQTVNNNLTTGNLSTNTGDIQIINATGTTTSVGSITTTGANDIQILSFLGNAAITGATTGVDATLTVTAAGNVSVGSVNFSGANSNIRLTGELGTVNANGGLTGGGIQVLAGTDINVGGTVSSDTGIVLAASRDINSTSALSFDTSNGAGAGGPITLIAGASFTDDPGTDITINGNSLTGGRIHFLPGGGLTSINSTGTTGGGRVNLIAYSNGITGGQVLLPTSSTITTTATGANFSGTVNVIAGAVSGTAIQVGNITTSSATNGDSGLIALQASSPASGAVISTSVGTAGQVLSGGFVNSLFQSAGISAQTLTARGQQVYVEGGGNVGVNSINVAGRANENGGQIFVRSAGADVMNIGTTGGSNFLASLNANGGSTSGNGGIIQINETGAAGMLVNPLSITVTEGNGGTVELFSNGQVALNGGTYRVNAAGTGSHFGGTYTIQGASIVAPNTNVEIQANGINGLSLGVINLTTTNSSQSLTLGSDAGEIRSVALVNGIVNATSAGNLIVNGGAFNAANVNLVTNQPGSDVVLNETNTVGALLTINSADEIQLNGTMEAGTSIDGQAGFDIFGAGLFRTGTLTLETDLGDIGVDANNRLNGDVSGVAFFSADFGSVYYHGDNNVRLGTSSVAVLGGELNVEADNDLALESNNSFNGATQIYRALGGSISIGSNATVNAGSSVTLQAFNSIVDANFGPSITLNTPQLNLISDNGNIGTSASDRLDIDAQALTAVADNGNVYIDDPNAVTIGAGASSADGDFDVRSATGLTVTGTIDATDVTLRVTNGAFTVSNTVTGSSSISLRSSASITSIGSGSLVSPQINLTSDNGNIGVDANNRLVIDADNLTVNTPLGSSFIFDPNSVTLGSGTSAAGAVIDVRAQIDLTVFGDVQAPTVFLRSNAGDIDQTGGNILAISLRLEGSNDITITNTFSPSPSQSIQVLGTATANANITTQEGGAVFLDASTGLNIILNASQASAGLATSGDTIIGGTLDLTAVEVVNAFDLEADTINIQSPSGSALVFDGTAGGGTLTANGPGGVNITATDFGLTFEGVQDIFGPAQFTVTPFNSINISVGADIQGFDSVTLNTCNINWQGNLQGNPLILNCPLGAGTIANSIGSVNLASDIIFNGLSLAIIARDDINDTGIDFINLERASGDGPGGTLTMVAGYNFTPATLGQEDFVDTIFTITTPSAGGSINLGGVAINTSATSPTSNDGGGILAVANGSVSLGSFDTSSANGAGGDVTIIASGGINIAGNSTTVGDTGSGAVSMTVAAPQTVGTVMIGDGRLLSGSFTSGLASSGNISLAGLNAGDASVSLTGALTSTDSISQSSGVLTAGILDIIAGAGDTVINSSDVDFLNSISNGLVVLSDNAGAIAITSVVGNGQRLGVFSDDSITLSSPALLIESINLTQLNAAGSININADIDADLTVILSSTGNVSINNSIDAGTNVQVTANGVVDFQNDVTAGGALTVSTTDLSFTNNSTLTAATGLTLNTVNAITGNDGVAVTLNGGNQVSVSNDILISGAGITINADNANGTVTVNNIDVSGRGGDPSFVGAGDGFDGADGGSITITADSDISTGSLDTYGGGGGGAYVGNGGNAGSGGNVSLDSANGGVISVAGLINTSGGGGGGGWSGSGGSGGAAGSISITTSGAVVIDGPLLAAGGGAGGGSGSGGGGGGSFGGGGGGVDDGGPVPHASGGGGYYGGASSNDSGVGGGGGGFGQGGLAASASGDDGGLGFGGGPEGGLFGQGGGGAGFGPDGDDVLLTQAGSGSINVQGSSIAVDGNVGTAWGFANYTDLSVFGSNVTLQASTGEVTVNGAINAANGDVTIRSNTFTTVGDLTAFGGDANITANTLNNSFLIRGESVNVQSKAGFGLTINGSVAPGGTMLAASGATNLTATDLDLDLNGEQSLIGPAVLTVDSFRAINVNATANFVGDDSVTLNTCNLNLVGNISGNPLILNCPLGAGSIVNSSGDVDLTGLGSLFFTGQSLAILASGDVIGSDTVTINLSSVSNHGGELLVVAGFDFTPATMGQENFSPGTYTFTGPSASGGSIFFASMNINTSSGLNEAGSVQLIANGGAVEIGTITANSNAGFPGGVVSIIAENGINAGIINATGNTAGGTISLSVAEPEITGGTIFVANGHQFGNGSFTAGTRTTGDLSYITANAGTGTVNLIGALDLNSNITGTNTTANTVNLSVGDAGVTSLTSSDVRTLNLQGGTFSLVALANNTGNLALNVINSGGQLAVTTTGVITTTGPLLVADNLILNGSDVELSTNIIATSGLTVLASNTGVTLGGTIDTDNLLVIATGGIDISGTVTVITAADLTATTGDLSINTGGSLVGDGNKTLIANAGNIELEGPLTGHTISLTTFGSSGVISSPVGVITTGPGGLTVNIADGLADLVADNNVSSLDTNVTGTGAVVLINDDNDITIGNLSGANQRVTVETTGTITLSEAITVDELTLIGGGTGLDINQTITTTGETLIQALQGALTVSSTGSLAGAGNKELVGNAAGIFLNGAVSGDEVFLMNNDGDISQDANGVITTAVLRVTLGTGFAVLNAANNNVGTFYGDGGGFINLFNDVNALQLGSVGEEQTIILTTTNVGGIVNLGDITTTGDITLYTPYLGNAFNIEANTITVFSATDLTVDGFTGSTYNATGAGQLVNFTATTDLNLLGNITFVSEAATFVGLGNTTTIDLNAVVTGQQRLTITSCNVDKQGTLTGSPLVFVNPCQAGFTIANSLGSVTLTGDIIFVGTDFAIIAANDILAGPATQITLLNPTGNGGNLTMLAGFDFTPATSGQETTDQQFTITGLNSDGGSILLSGVQINTSGSDNGGNVVAIANGGDVSDGNVAIGQIVATGGINGGNVNILAEGNIQTGSIDVSGTTNSGSVTLTNAEPTINGTVLVEDGVVTGLDNIAAGALNDSNMTVSSVTGAYLSANTNGVALFQASSLSGLDTSGSGSITLQNEFDNLTLGNVSGAGQTLDITATGVIGGTTVVSVGDLILDAELSYNFLGAARLQATNSITLKTGSNLDNSQLGADTLVTPILNLVSRNGANIGLIGTPLQISDDVADIRIDSMTGAGGVVSVQSLSTAGVFLGLSNLSSDFEFISNGPLSVAGNITLTDGDARIVATRGLLRINNDVDVLANSPGTNGNIFIGNNLNGADKTATIVMGLGSTIKGNAGAVGGGNVTIQLGVDPTRIRQIRQPRNVEFQPTNPNSLIVGGRFARTFYAGQRTGDQPLSIVRAVNATVTINNTVKTRSIILEGNNLIDADPPAPLTTAAVVEEGARQMAGSDASVLEMSSMTAPHTVAEPQQATNGLSFNTADLAINAIGNSLTANHNVFPAINGAGFTTATGNDQNPVLFGSVASDIEDDSFMVSEQGPNGQADASLCSDIELGVGKGVTRTAHGEKVVLRKGNVLFMPSRNTVVETPHGLVKIEAHSVALVSSSDAKLAVYDLEDSHKGAVSVEAHGQKIALAPGNHVTLADSSEFALVNAIEAIPHRNVRSHAIKSGLRAHTSEFSIPSAIQSVKPLQVVVNSKHPEARKIANRMMKTTAVLMHIGGTSGDYQHYFKPSVTAMAK